MTISMHTITTGNTCQSSSHQQLTIETLRGACSHVFAPPKSSCKRFLINQLSREGGLGHQFTELLFGLRKARSNNLSYVYEPFSASGTHQDNYAFVNELLGLPRMFASLGATSRQHAEDSVVKANSSWTVLDDNHLPDDCNQFRYVRGYHYCNSTPNKDCFKAPENEYLYQDAAACLRAAVVAYGTAFDRCVFNNDELSRLTLNTSEQILARATHLRVLPNNNIVVVWHVRVGDIVLHQPSDPFYERVLGVLKEITAGYKLHLLLIGKGEQSNDSTFRVAHDYTRSVSTLVAQLWNGSQAIPTVGSPKLSFPDAFTAMMQADVLIGSGSSLPAIASLVSGEPLFFNHVMKHGYMHGSEMLEDSVDMHSDGTVLDSHRRLKIALHKRMRIRQRLACPFAESAMNDHR